MPKLIKCLDYKSKAKEKPIIGYKLNLTKSGIKETGITEKDNLSIEYYPDRIVVTKEK